MFSIDIDSWQTDKDMLTAELWEAGCSGIVELGETWRVFFGDDARRNELRSRFGGEPQPADTRDWVEFAHRFLQPMRIGQSIFVCPEWREDVTPAGCIRIEVNAGLAFGTGAHETTRLCLEALERHVRPGMTVADIGTGSGILAEAAAKLGASRISACDTDPDAVAVARENFARAGVRVDLAVGSANLFADASADIVVANISPGWIIDLAREWPRILRPGGMGILSGFEGGDVTQVTAALYEAGARVTGEFGENEWRMLVISGPR
jgi:ribosomal protein L11 methyltransferase